MGSQGGPAMSSAIRSGYAAERSSRLKLKFEHNFYAPAPGTETHEKRAALAIPIERRYDRPHGLALRLSYLWCHEPVT